MMNSGIVSGKTPGRDICRQALPPEREKGHPEAAQFGLVRSL